MTVSKFQNNHCDINNLHKVKSSRKCVPNETKAQTNEAEDNNDKISLL